jgi:copper chaperone NosL
VALLALGALAGLADFWKWGYDYGHDLDPTAAIKIPGMSYQPPVLGSKQLLNFHATSLPAVGGWIAFGVLAVGLVLVIREFRRGRRLAAAGA